MNAQQAILLLATLLALPDAPFPGIAPAANVDAVQTKAIILAIMQACGVDTTSFEPGDPTERDLDAFARAMATWGVVPTQAVRSLFFALATDPGDVDDFGTPDPSPDQTPRPGMLSAVGQGFWGTTRGGAGFATSFVTIQNQGPTASLPFGPGQLTLEASGQVRPDGGTPTYINTADSSIYTGIGGVITLAPNASIVIPVQAVQIGSYGSASLNGIDTVVTQSYGKLMAIASTTAQGQDREARPAYINRCQTFADANSPGGPVRAYLRAMSTYSDGTLLQRHDGSGPVNILTASSYVSSSNPYGITTIYYAGATGAVDQIDVDSANANITGLPLGVITAPIGVLPDGMTLAPTTYGSSEALPAGTPGGASASDLHINVTYTVKIKSSKVVGGASPGTYTTPGTGSIAKVFAAISAGLGSALAGMGTGGVDQTAGAGVVYTSDIQDAIVPSYAGLYAPSVTVPSGSTTAVNLGYCPVAGTIAGTLTVVAG
jgi:hypothetical protein